MNLNLKTSWNVAKCELQLSELPDVPTQLPLKAPNAGVFPLRSSSRSSSSSPTSNPIPPPSSSLRPHTHHSVSVASPCSHLTCHLLDCNTHTHMWAHTRSHTHAHTYLYTQTSARWQLSVSPGCHGNSFPARCGEKWDVSSVRTHSAADDWRLAVIWLFTARNLLTNARHRNTVEQTRRHRERLFTRSRRTIREVGGFCMIHKYLTVNIYSWDLASSHLCRSEASQASYITNKIRLHHREDFLCEFDPIIKLPWLI